MSLLHILDQVKQAQLLLRQVEESIDLLQQINVLDEEYSTDVVIVDHEDVQDEEIIEAEEVVDVEEEVAVDIVDHEVVDHDDVKAEVDVVDTVKETDSSKKKRRSKRNLHLKEGGGI